MIDKGPWEDTTGTRNYPSRNFGWEESITESKAWSADSRDNVAFGTWSGSVSDRLSETDSLMLEKIRDVWFNHSN